MGLTPEGWIAVAAVAVGSFIVGRVVYTKILKPKEQPENSNSSSPPILYNGIYERTTLGGSRKNKQRKNKSRRR